jgi:hypothetical protein
MRDHLVKLITDHQVDLRRDLTTINKLLVDSHRLPAESRHPAYDALGDLMTYFSSVVDDVLDGSPMTKR